MQRFGYLEERRDEKSPASSQNTAITYTVMVKWLQKDF